MRPALPVAALAGLVALAACTPAPVAVAPTAVPRGDRAATPPPAASAEHAAVVAAVQRLFDGMAAADTAALRRALHPSAQLVVVGSGGRVEAIPAAEWIRSFSTPRGRIVERMWDAKVEVRGALASLWAPYDLTVDGRFSHCGVDAVQLVRTAEGWKPVVVAFTMERTGCPTAPPRS